jgi:undecaprenyl-diphosphatase
LIVILLVFYKDIKELIIGLTKRDKKAAKYLLKLAIASVPIALVGYFLNDFIKSIFNSLTTVGISLLITSAFLFMSKYPKVKNRNLTIKNTFLIGLAQALAILPGVSRSGATISAGLMQGIKREKTAAFAFLMFIPAIIGATLLEMKNMGQIENLWVLSSGLVTVIISGYLSLRLLLFIINKDKLSYFGWYCLSLGLFLLAYAKLYIQ